MEYASTRQTHNSRWNWKNKGRWADGRWVYRHKGEIEFLEIRPRVGSECRPRNPWPGKTVTLYHNGEKAENLSGWLLKFPTVRGKSVMVVFKGSTRSRKRVPCKRSVRIRLAGTVNLPFGIGVEFKGQRNRAMTQ